MKRYSFHELRRMAKEKGYKRTYCLNKDELCNLLGIVRTEHIPKYILTNTLDEIQTMWSSVYQMGKSLRTNPGNIFYAVKKGLPLNVQGTSYFIEKIRD